MGGDRDQCTWKLALALGPGHNRANLWPDELSDEQADQWLGRAWAQREQYPLWRGAACVKQLLQRAAVMLDTLGGLDARPLFVGEDQFPARLLRVPSAPSVVFVRGTLPVEGKRRVAIVGARAAYRAGLQAAGKLARSLADEGHVVVSGGALGIDAAAHQGSLEGGGPTVAVLGCGLDIDYPERHAGLFARVAQQGALLTPFAPGQPPRKGHFPRRNALLTALSDLVVIVEAQRRSGALNTAKWAQRLGVGLVTFPDSPGGRYLLARGVPSVDGPESVLAALDGDVCPASGGKATLGPDAARVLSLLVEGGAELDEMALRAGTTVSRMAMLLLQLELAGYVVCGPDGRYRSEP